MRVGLSLLGLVAAVVGAFVACSSFTASDPVPTSDAGIASDAGTTSDAGADSATAPVDAALPPTPGMIDCFGTPCSTEGNTSCCIAPDAGTTSCASSCPSATLTIRCDDNRDCAPNQFCCVGFFGDTSCEAACAGTGERLCHATSECETGSTCLQVPCRGTTIGVCGPLRGYVKSFCNIK